MCDFENDMLKFIFVKTTEKKLVKNFSLEKNQERGFQFIMMNFLRKQMKWVMAIIVVAFLLSTFLMYEGGSTRRTPTKNADGTMSDYEVAGFILFWIVFVLTENANNKSEVNKLLEPLLHSAFMTVKLFSKLGYVDRRSFTGVNIRHIEQEDVKFQGWGRYARIACHNVWEVMEITFHSYLTWPVLHCAG